jgi:hypothetical protein
MGDLGNTTWPVKPSVNSPRVAARPPRLPRIVPQSELLRVAFRRTGRFDAAPNPISFVGAQADDSSDSSQTIAGNLLGMSRASNRAQER